MKKGHGWSKGLRLPYRTPLDDYLSNKVQITSHKLRIRLLEESVFTHKCSMCENTTWLDKPIPLELDHIDGNKKNNSMENLRLLCPNCHTLTPTYKTKNWKKK